MIIKVQQSHFTVLEFSFCFNLIHFFLTYSRYSLITAPLLVTLSNNSSTLPSLLLYSLLVSHYPFVTSLCIWSLPPFSSLS